MPEQDANIEKCLEALEDFSLDAHLLRTQSYNNIRGLLEHGVVISKVEIDRILIVCDQDLRNDMRCAFHVISVISSVLKRAKTDSISGVNYTPTALGIVNLLTTTVKVDTIKTIQQLLFDTLLLYPSESFVELATNHSNVLFEFFDSIKSLTHSSLEQSLCILHKILLSLQYEQKIIFVKDGLVVWFSVIIPCIMNYYSTTSPVSVKPVETFEALTSCLIHIDYSNHPIWRSVVFNNILNKYSPIMKTLVEKGSSVWHRLWTIFVKLLKRQVIVSHGKISPINALLPVVELAFKLDIPNRCKAFQVWCVLIDTFAAETSQNNIKKRTNLLLIPLLSKNAKVRETAIAKLNTWFYMLIKFQDKDPKYVDTILMPYLQFAFGKKNDSTQAPGQLTEDLRLLSAESLIEMLGHVDCSGCVNLPKMSSKLITVQLLVEHWVQWVYVLNTASKALIDSSDKSTDQKLLCLWKSFIFTITELPDNCVRKDLFNDILNIINDFLEVSQTNTNHTVKKKIFFAVISLFARNEIKPLFKSHDIMTDPLHKVLVMLQTMPLEHFSDSTEELVVSLRPLFDVVMDEKFCSPNETIEWLLKNIQPNNSTLIIWTAMVDALTRININIWTQNLYDVLVWPLSKISMYTNAQHSTSLWFVFYNFNFSKLSMYSLQTSIMELIVKNSNIETPSPNLYFKLTVLCGVLKTNIDNLQTETVESLKDTLDNIKDAKSVEKVLPTLVDTLTLLLNKVLTFINVNLADYVVKATRKTIQLLIQTVESFGEKNSDHLVFCITNLLKPIDILFKTAAYAELKLIILEELVINVAFFDKHKDLKDNVCKMLLKIPNNRLDSLSHVKVKEAVKTFMEFNKAIETSIDINKKEINSTDNENNNIDNNKNVPTTTKTGTENKDDKIANEKQNEFPTPNIKNVSKSKKKGLNIVNTVVENGEEYVVVKSNWKFNPRKLTEHQKERLQKKREDIPALYQDLSQSQDECKLTPWKTDSQDTSATSSKSTNDVKKEDASTILKSVQNSEIVPRIMENILDNNNKNLDTKVTQCIQDKDAKLQQSPATTNKRRMALKDRIFRNVKNLMEKSSTKGESTNLSTELLNQTINENVPKTPASKAEVVPMAVYSAPPKLVVDRPMRSKRKPKRLEDSEVFALRKKQRSLSQNSSQPDSPLDSEECIDKDLPNNIIPEKVSSNNASNQSPESKELNKNESENNNVSNKVEKELSNNANCDRTLIVQNDLTDIPKSNTNTVNPSKPGVPIVKVNPMPLQTIETHNNNVVLEKVVAEIKTPKSAKFTLNSNMSSKKVDSNNEQILSEKNLNPSLLNEVAQSAAATHQTEECNTRLSTAEYTENNNALQSNDSNVIDVVTAPKTRKNTKNNIISNKESVDKPSTNESKIAVDDRTENVPSTKTNPKDTEVVHKTGLNTPITDKAEVDTCNTSTKKDKKSLIAKKLAIDMVEGHPLLNGTLPTRAKRKCALNTSPGNSSNKNDTKSNVENSSEKSSKEPSVSKLNKTESSDMSSNHSDDMSCSEDVIESSQDSTMTTISVRPVRKTRRITTLTESAATPKSKTEISKPSTPQKANKFNDGKDKNETTIPSNKNLTASASKSKISKLSKEVKHPKINKNIEDKDDSVLPVNRTREQVDLTTEMDTEPFDSKLATTVSNQVDLTQEMDTEPFDEKILDTNLHNSDVIFINDDEPPVIIDSATQVGHETLEIATANTQPVNPEVFNEEMNISKVGNDQLEVIGNKKKNIQDEISENITSESVLNNDDVEINTQNDKTTTFIDIIASAVETGTDCSPYKDEEKNKEFLNDTIEISPIKTMSPVREKKSPSPDNSNDYVVIRLSSPVQSNGEPFEKGESSPEIFTEDKISPDKRDASPTREPIATTNTSPSLSLKKNRPMRSGNRAAQMLGLCVPDKLQTLKTTDKSETEEIKKPIVSTPARRNLRILYSSVGENVDSSDSNASGNFLTFDKPLPSATSSPAGPILKRKLVEIDEVAASPASKRKRVSFHDPPVSTTISVQKYIEPLGLQSPSNSHNKRQERQARSCTMKSPKRLDNSLKLDTVIITDEDISEITPCSNEDTQLSSLEQTPAVEIIKTSELNDSDAICPELVDCKDPIDNIAGELSSPAMKVLLVKELAGKIETVGDLAKLSELEINRLCIKAPKVKVAKKVLSNYLKKISKAKESEKIIETDIEPEAVVINKAEVEVQTDSTIFNDVDMQTDVTPVTECQSQTDALLSCNQFVQTYECGEKSTAEIIKTCILDRHDFVDQLRVHLDQSSTKQIAEKLSTDGVTDLLVERFTPENTSDVLDKLISQISIDKSKTSVLENYLCDRFKSNELIMFCSNVLKRIHDRCDGK